MSYAFRGMTIPSNMLDAMHRYADHGVPVGDFLTAVFANDLREACGRADDENIHLLPAYAAWVYNCCPNQAHGSREKVAAWIRAHQARRDAAERDSMIYDTDPQASPE